jgi:hypothetical protein
MLNTRRIPTLVVLLIGIFLGVLFIRACFAEGNVPSEACLRLEVAYQEVAEDSVACGVCDDGVCKVFGSGSRVA